VGHMNHFTYGWLTPLLSYAMACVGGALGLRCTVRALAATGTARRNWLATASLAIGSGIWTMHFIAMLGFSVSGSAIRYDVPLTALSLIVAILVVGAGVFTAGYGASRVRSVLVGGLGTGIGIAAMHYIGMAALRLHGDVEFSPLLVVLSVLIAVASATAALWAALTVNNTAGAAGASLVMGVAVSSMHYTGMAAVSVRLTPGQAELSGATATEFIFPLAVVLGSFLFLTSAFVALSPTARQRSESDSAVRRLHDVETRGVQLPSD
jgi:NO-binding membrane sensor protein with MHYT domain